ncbi:MAG TPA: hypothetical protein VFV49_11230, partial [Thermoanaerobaculia bacterium]|nr:hypothetical protein [Thermoanaerobaculia bacterium]
MRIARTLLLLLLTAVTAVVTAPLSAVTPLPPYSQWPACDTGNCGDTNNCYSYRSFRYDQALQFKDGDGKSARSTSTPSSPYGICSGSFGWCKLPPQLGSVQAV